MQATIIDSFARQYSDQHEFSRPGPRILSWYKKSSAHPKLVRAGISIAYVHEVEVLHLSDVGM